MALSVAWKQDPLEEHGVYIKVAYMCMCWGESWGGGSKGGGG